MSPLTKNGLNHIKTAYRRGWRERTASVSLYFKDRDPIIVQAIWHNTDTADPQLGPSTSASLAKTAASADAAFEVMTDDAPIALLERVLHVQLTQGFGGPDLDPAFSSAYLIVEIQPKGTAFPPNRAYVLLRRAGHIAATHPK